ncbi:hypothetical protein LSTR_LSTR010293 [Laodelphax striatellus]|uniref:Uncharacterized protein n=1 Tax=Laodelphax striatellus TaxID=195883 RepID=A0A482XS49_LAOST|nr:hypothetical protein LSTR_LSTR010293 [Laodelphax striatellus]
MTSFYVSGLLVCLLAYTSAAPRLEDNEVIGRSVEDDGGWKLISKILSDCGSDDTSRVMGCLGVKAVSALDRAARAERISVLPGVSLIRSDSEDADRAGRALLTEDELQNSLPQDPSERSSRLVDMLFDSAFRFMKTHSLQLKFPEEAPEALQRALEEGRGKIKKKLFPILMLVGLKIFAVIPVILGIIGLVAAKALVVGKLALIIAASLGLQKFFAVGAGAGGFPSLGKVTSDGWNSGSSAGWSSPSSGAQGGYYRRSMDDNSAHQMAFNAQVPDTYKTQ